jgi:hypothetical protein
MKDLSENRVIVIRAPCRHYKAIEQGEAYG